MVSMVLTFLAACDAGPGDAHVMPGSDFGGRVETALNGRLELQLDGPVDPLSVTPRSVIVQAPDGSGLPCERVVSGGSIGVLLVVDAELLADPPDYVDVTLIGGPSVHALATRDGRRLRESVRRRFEMHAGLQAEGARPPRLLSPLPTTSAGTESMLGTPLVLHFDGPLAPDSVSPESCPAFPVAGGLTLDALLPVVHWKCTGQRFVLSLEWERPHGELLLDLRRWRLHGLAGAPPRPAPRLLIAAVTAG